MISVPKSAYLDTMQSLFEERLPWKWNPKDKFPTLCVGPDDRTLHYTGFGKSYRDAASIRSDHCIPKECAMFYFEIEVLSQGKDGYLAVGLMGQNVNLQRLPGWERDSYGYHGDDGNAFAASSTGKPYGPPYHTGDVIGCCLNQITSTLFFTKNGISLGTAFTKIQPNLHPCMGLQSAEESIRVNFGQDPFVFDIDNYFMGEQQKLSRQIITRAWPIRGEVYGLAGCVDPSQVQLTPEYETKNINRQRFAMDFVMSGMMKRLALGYFKHHGLANTAEKFATEMALRTDERLNEDNADNCLLMTRKEIKDLIMSGKASQAAQAVYQKFPAVWKNKPELFYKMCVQNFIESVRNIEEPWLDENISEAIPKLSGKDDHAMDVDEENASKQPVEKEQNGWDQSTEDRSSQDVALMLLAKKLYRMCSAVFDLEELEEQYDLLKNVVCVMAYPNPGECPASLDMFEDTRRANLSVEINNAILEELGKLSMPALEQFICHVDKLNDTLSENVSGHGGVIDFHQWL